MCLETRSGPRLHYSFEVVAISVLWLEDVAPESSGHDRVRGPIVISEVVEIPASFGRLGQPPGPLSAVRGS